MRNWGLQRFTTVLKEKEIFWKWENSESHFKILSKNIWSSEDEAGPNSSSDQGILVENLEPCLRTEVRGWGASG